jgi:ABC-2 type transport system ATP-binding protein
MSDDAVIVVRGLKKSYGDVVAIDGLDLEIRRGEIFAMLGPNGAGKTSTIEILEGFRTRDAGSVSVLGFDPGPQRRRIKGRMGVVLQSTGVDPYLSVAETVAMYANYYPNPRPVDEVIDLVGLTQKRNTRVLKLSGGQQRRLDVAIALAGDPELLFLDEPTTGFDPSARHEAWEVVRNLASLGKTVLLTTHYMDEAQSLADRVAVVAAGRIVAQGSPSSLGGRDTAFARIRYRVPNGFEPPPNFVGAVDSEGFMELRPNDLTKALHELTGWALNHGASLDSLQIVRPSLEDVYLSLINEAPGSPQ